MPSRIVINGHTIVRSRNWRPPHPRPDLPTNAKGELIDTNPVAAEKADDVPQVLGHSWRDPANGLIYRIVAIELRPEDGWAPMPFWFHRYGTSFHVWKKWVADGLVDAAIRYGYPERLFRVRDDARVRSALRAIREDEINEAIRKSEKRTMPR